MSMVDQLPCGPVLTPAISCTKLKIHSAHADSNMARTRFVSLFLGRTSLCFTDQKAQEENAHGGPNPLWVSAYTSYLLYKAKIHSAHADSPMAKTIFVSLFLRRTSLCVKDQEAQGENEHGGPTPLRVSAYISYLLYKAQDPFSTYRQSQGQDTFFLYF